MTLGLVLECGREGPDERVCRHMIERIRPGLPVSTVTLSNKPRLIEGCGDATAQLLSEGCRLVVVVWDLYPTWRETTPCRRADREAIQASLVAAAVNTAKVKLVCITEELEAWLIADAQAVSNYISTAAHRKRFDQVRHPARVNPKMLLRRAFRESRHRDYRDYEHALPLARHARLEQVRRVDSFARFETFVSQA